MSLLNPLKNLYYKKKENREKNTTLKGHISKTRMLPNLPAKVHGRGIHPLNAPTSLSVACGTEGVNDKPEKC